MLNKTAAVFVLACLLVFGVCEKVLKLTQIQEGSAAWKTPLRL